MNEVIGRDIEPLYREGDSLQAQENLLHPSQNEGGPSRRGSLYDKESRSPLVQPENKIDAVSILGRYPDGPAPCPMCCVVVDRTSWKYVFSSTRFSLILTVLDASKHIAEDLRPYVCLVKSCTDTQSAFMYHGDWVSHMAQKHWRSWNCPFCPSINCSSPAILRFHVSLQHPNEVPPRQID